MPQPLASPFEGPSEPAQRLHNSHNIHFSSPDIHSGSHDPHFCESRPHNSAMPFEPHVNVTPNRLPAPSQFTAFASTPSQYPNVLASGMPSYPGDPAFTAFQSHRAAAEASGPEARFLYPPNYSILPDFAGRRPPFPDPASGLQHFAARYMPTPAPYYFGNENRTRGSLWTADETLRTASPPSGSAGNSPAFGPRDAPHPPPPAPAGPREFPPPTSYLRNESWDYNSQIHGWRADESMYPLPMEERRRSPDYARERIEAELETMRMLRASHHRTSHRSESDAIRSRTARRRNNRTSMDLRDDEESRTRRSRDLDIAALRSATLMQMNMSRRVVLSTFKRATKEAVSGFSEMPLAEMEDKNCHICMEELGIPDPVNNVTELPVKLPCGHIFGQVCIEKWMSEHCTCPTCRREVEHEVVSVNKACPREPLGRLPNRTETRESSEQQGSSSRTPSTGPYASARHEQEQSSFASAAIDRERRRNANRSSQLENTRPDFMHPMPFFYQPPFNPLIVHSSNNNGSSRPVLTFPPLQPMPPAPLDRTPGYYAYPPRRPDMQSDARTAQPVGPDPMFRQFRSMYSPMQAPYPYNSTPVGAGPALHHRFGGMPDLYDYAHPRPHSSMREEEMVDRA